MISNNINLLIAFAAGLLSFLSPCILPLIPSYLSFVGGITYNELKMRDRKKTGIFIKTLFFVGGFTIIFIALGILFSSTGALLGSISKTVNIIAGALVIALGINFIFDFWKMLEVEKKFHVESSPRGYVGSVLLGMAFAAGWTPCVGPILAGILFLAGTTGKLAAGIFLLTSYSAGLGLPFILAGLFFNSFIKQLQNIRSHLKAIKIGSGIFLIAVGVLIILGRLQRFNMVLFKLSNTIEAVKQQNPAYMAHLFGTLFFIPGAALLFLYLKRIFRRKHSAKISLYPALLIFTLFFLVIGILTFLRVIDTSKIITFWFTFQGI